MLIHDLQPIIQVSVSPVIVISGVGLVLLSMTNRYGRVIDKARSLLDKLHSGDGSNRGRLGSQIHILYSRCRSLRVAIFLASLSLLLMALLIGLLFVFSLLHLELALLIVALFVSSMISLSASLVYFLSDINTSLHALSIEVNHKSEMAPQGVSLRDQAFELHPERTHE